MIKINILQNHPEMVEIFWYLEGVCVSVPGLMVHGEHSTCFDHLPTHTRKTKLTLVKRYSRQC